MLSSTYYRLWIESCDFSFEKRSTVFKYLFYVQTPQNRIYIIYPYIRNCTYYKFIPHDQRCHDIEFILIPFDIKHN